MVEYDVVSCKDPELLEFAPEFDNRWVEEWTRAVVRRQQGKIIEVLGTDGGEPEDQTLTRDWSWVVSSLNDAYSLGYERGREPTRPRDVWIWTSGHG